MNERCVQEIWASSNACFGCGPANSQGLRIRSFEADDALVASWTPQPHHEAFPGVLNGGIIGTLLDCQCNWAAALSLMRVRQVDKPPCTVTAEYAIALKRPCPSEPVELRARVVECEGNRCVVEGELTAAGKLRATCRGVFVAVEEGHPAFHRW